MDQLRPSQADKGVKWEGYPDVQSLPRSLPPRLFTYEEAHGGCIRIPVTLPKRHGSPRDSGPGNPPPPLSGSRLHPLGVPGSSSSPALFPTSRRRLRVLPGRCGAPGTWSRAPGAGAAGRGSGSPAHLLRSRLQVRWASGGPLVEPAGGAQGASSGPRWTSRPGGARGPGTTAWELEISVLIPPPTGQIAAFLCASCSPL